MKNIAVNHLTDNKADIKMNGAILLSKDEARTFLSKANNKNYKKSWWLRSAGFGKGACDVYNGSINKLGINVTEEDVYVRPALQINIKNTQWKIGDNFVFAGKQFTIISPCLAWMIDDDIGAYPFKKESTSDSCNIYASSDVKLYVDKWFEDAIKAS